MPDDEKKIFIDEGWKAQVEREREQLRQAPAEESPAPVGVPAGEAVDDEGDGEEASLFEHMVSGLAAQCMMALGLIAPQGQTQVMVDLGYAQHIIETLDMLREKTVGNLTEQEDAMMAEALSELQRAFAVRVQQAQEAQLKQQGVDLSDLRNPKDFKI